MKCIHAISVAALLAAILPASLGAQTKYEYEFTTVKENPVTSIKNQYRSGTCWCFSALSFLESEIIRDKKIKDEAQYPDLSEMFVVRNAYHDRAAKYVRLDGSLGFSAGSDFGDVMEVIRDYGILPQSAYSGMNYGTELPVQGELDAVLKGYVEAVVKNPNRNLSTAWMRGFDGILDAYLGELPADDPKACRDQLGINTDDYVGLTSLTHHPFYTDFAIEVQDNWRWTRSWNVPLDEFQSIVDNAIDKGYTVLWGGDVSEPGFTRTGLAILLDNTKKPTSGSDQERWVGKSEDKADAANRYARKISTDKAQSVAGGMFGEGRKKKVAMPARPETYTVQEGDTLYRISTRFYGSSAKWRAIRELNKATISTDGRLRAGQVIRLP